MSTGADCYFYEKPAGKWFYKIQEYPYGETEDYETNGPFPTFRKALDHLDAHHANPGGWSVSPQPGCKHDLLAEDSWDKSYSCDRCGHHLSKDEAKKHLFKNDGKVTVRKESD